MGAGESHPELQADAPKAQRHEGLLLKESETVKDWNQRYAVLESGVLSYYDSEDQAKKRQQPRGRIDVQNCRVSETGADDIAHPSCFVVETPKEERRTMAQRGQTTMYFQPPTDEDLHAWLRALQVASREPWAANGDDPGCAGCARPFDLFSRRHHCRRCGRVVCEACSPHRQAMPLMAYTAPVRVCNDCNGNVEPLAPAADRKRAAEETAAQAEKRRADERRAELDRRAADRKAAMASRSGGGGAGGGNASVEERRAKLREKYIK
jgi:hypothetical protein